MRCCKDLGIASELWDPRFIKKFMAEMGKETFVEHQMTKKRRRHFMRKDDEVKFPFKDVGMPTPGVPSGSGGSASSGVTGARSPGAKSVGGSASGNGAAAKGVAAQAKQAYQKRTADTAAGAATPAAKS